MGAPGTPHHSKLMHIEIVTLLAQASPDTAIQSFLAFLAKVMLLCGVVAIFWGGWKISRGETADGLVALVGGFIVALAVPIIHYLASLGGVTF